MLAAGHPQGYGLDPGEDGAALPTGMPALPKPRSKCNDVSRHPSTMTRDITGVEPTVSWLKT